MFALSWFMWLPTFQVLVRLSRSPTTAFSVGVSKRISLLSLETCLTSWYEWLVVGITAVADDPGVTPIVGSACSLACSALCVAKIGRCPFVGAPWIVVFVEWMRLRNFFDVDWIRWSEKMFTLIIEQLILCVEVAGLNQVGVSSIVVVATP